MELIAPSLDYKDSWLAAIAEIEAEQPDLHGPGSGVLMSLVCDPRNLEEYIRLSKQFSEGKELPDGWVACSNYWLVDNGEYIGAANFRHELSDTLREIGGHIGYFIRPSKQRMGYGSQLLKLTLEKIKAETDLERVLVTCSETNQGSQKVIENNGGVFKDHSSTLHNGEKTRRYWIDL